MTDEVPPEAVSTLEDQRAFERTDDGWAVTTTPFDATVEPSPATAEGRDVHLTVSVEVPTLDAAVEGETVADVVGDGWFETFELRLEDAYDVAEVDSTEVATIERDRDTVTADFAFHAWSAERGVADAKAIVDYVEGTYVQGVVPGYEYRDPVAGLVSRATDAAGGEDEGARRGGTPL